ncbi:MAG: group III truncated hemoglobin [Paracoccus sp. (in: a-proteobacteria)]|uniref:group III truncated hemoglobin n=1 Tax=Paracoccus sp. TaxID=267 RepID=UPI0026DF85BF|nr:group III truncated hemoglobin [Paracoccus sp. (in: a-proteobacteria)]MDO5620622.1 group III truncated hemoglobin [Paracoccus sp. (in: a-proteobacteria)]
MTIPPRFPVTEQQIAQVVAVFYAAIRRHEVLGPVFAAHVTDWPEHEEKIAAFWRNAILYQRGYDGNPMRIHHATPEIRADHFATWLELFDETLRRTLPEDLALAWSMLAHRIGAGLRMGIESRDAPAGQAPRLRW